MRYKRITKARATECRTCQGIGYTEATRTEMESMLATEGGKSKLRTRRQGSGCPDCCGIGQRA